MTTYLDEAPLSLPAQSKKRTSQYNWSDPAKFVPCIELAVKAKEPVAAMMTFIRNKWRRTRRNPDGSITISNESMEKCGLFLSRCAKHRAIKFLEKAGRIRVAREGSKEPRVWVIEGKEF